jgi:hypothetical protein
LYISTHALIGESHFLEKRKTTFCELPCRAVTRISPKIYFEKKLYIQPRNNGEIGLIKLLIFNFPSLNFSVRQKDSLDSKLSNN